jgi:hypothetical protein
MTANLRGMALAAAVVVLTAPAALAQTPVEQHPWSRSTALFGAAGLVVAADDQSDAWGGGVLAWQMAPRFGVAATALWMDRAGPASGFGADLSAEIALWTTPRGHRHYARLGVGLHRASFRTSAAGSREWIPAFYRDRLTAAPRDGEAVFTDPTILAGYGVDLRIGERFAMRPDVHVSVAMADGRANTMAFVGIQFGYRFNDNPVTPSRSPR